MGGNISMYDLSDQTRLHEAFEKHISAFWHSHAQLASSLLYPPLTKDVRGGAPGEHRNNFVTT